MNGCKQCLMLAKTIEKYQHALRDRKVILEAKFRDKHRHEDDRAEQGHRLLEISQIERLIKGGKAHGLEAAKALAAERGMLGNHYRGSVRKRTVPGNVSETWQDGNERD